MVLKRVDFVVPLSKQPLVLIPAIGSTVPAAAADAAAVEDDDDADEEEEAEEDAIAAGDVADAATCGDCIIITAAVAAAAVLQFGDCNPTLIAVLSSDGGRDAIPSIPVGVLLLPCARALSVASIDCGESALASSSSSSHWITFRFGRFCIPRQRRWQSPPHVTLLLKLLTPLPVLKFGFRYRYP